MIIRIIPETELEKQNMKTLEHTGVREFMVFGNKKDPDGLLIDFHEWSGQYRYLIGGVHYFGEILNDERKNRLEMARNQESHSAVMGPRVPQGPQGPQAPSHPNLKVVSVDGEAVPDTGLPQTQEELTAKVEAIQDDIEKN